MALIRDLSIRPLANKGNPANAGAAAARSSKSRRVTTKIYLMTTPKTGLLVNANSGPGILHQLTGVIAQHLGDIFSIAILEQNDTDAHIYFEIVSPGVEPMLKDLAAALSGEESGSGQEHGPDLREANHHHGRRCAGGTGGDWGSIEADRHNIRGEHISVDTIPLGGGTGSGRRGACGFPAAPGEGLWYLRGALMGGEIEQAVREVRQKGLLVISLNMAGSVPDASDLVVSDPVQAGVMAVMAVADTAKFAIEKAKAAGFL